LNTPATNAAPTAIRAAKPASSEITGVSASTLCAERRTAASIELETLQRPQPRLRASGVGRARLRRIAAKWAATSLARAGVIDPVVTGNSKTLPRVSSPTRCAMRYSSARFVRRNVGNGARSGFGGRIRATKSTQ